MWEIINDTQEEKSIPRSVVISSWSKPLDLKYLSAWSKEMEGEGKSTDEAVDVIPSLLPVNTGYDGPPACCFVMLG